jgi:hypothetical protein
MRAALLIFPFVVLLAGCASKPYWRDARTAAIETRDSCASPLLDKAGARYQVMAYCRKIRGRFPPYCESAKVYCD